jgi:hypothetical protein
MVPCFLAAVSGCPGVRLCNSSSCCKGVVWVPYSSAQDQRSGCTPTAESHALDHSLVVRPHFTQHEYVVYAKQQEAVQGRRAWRPAHSQAQIAHADKLLVSGGVT